VELKKAPKADIERFKSTGLLIGYIAALAIVFVGIEWSQSDSTNDDFLPQNRELFEDDAIPITQQPNLVPTPPKDAPSVADILNVVNDETKVNTTTMLTLEDDDSPLVESGKIAIVDETSDEQSDLKVKEEEDKSEQLIKIIDVMPEFPGGMEACMKFIEKNLKYPESCRQRNIQGQVMVQFIVGVDGSLSDIQVVKSVDIQLDRTALKVVKMMPKWKPGEKNGKKTKVKFLMPVTFINDKK